MRLVAEGSAAAVGAEVELAVGIGAAWGQLRAGLRRRLDSLRHLHSQRPRRGLALRLEPPSINYDSLTDTG